MGAHDLIDQAQPQAGARDRAGQLVAGAVEAVEDPLQVLGVDPDPAVLDRDHDEVALDPAHADADPALVGRVFDRVAEQVEDRAHDRVAVEVHRRQLPHRRELDEEVEAAHLRREAEQVDRLGHGVGDVLLGEHVVVLPRVGAGEVEHVLDQLLEPVRLAHDVLGVFLPLLLLLEPAHGEQLAIHLDRGQGRLQLVGHVRDEVRLHARQLERAAHVAERRDRARDRRREGQPEQRPVEDQAVAPRRGQLGRAPPDLDRPQGHVHQVHRGRLLGARQEPVVARAGVLARVGAHAAAPVDDGQRDLLLEVDRRAGRPEHVPRQPVEVEVEADHDAAGGPLLDAIGEHARRHPQQGVVAHLAPAPLARLLQERGDQVVEGLGPADALEHPLLAGGHLGLGLLLAQRGEDRAHSRQALQPLALGHVPAARSGQERARQGLSGLGGGPLLVGRPPQLGDPDRGQDPHRQPRLVAHGQRGLGRDLEGAPRRAGLAQALQAAPQAIGRASLEGRVGGLALGHGPKARRRVVEVGRLLLGLGALVVVEQLAALAQHVGAEGGALVAGVDSRRLLVPLQEGQLGPRPAPAPRRELDGQEAAGDRVRPQGALVVGTPAGLEGVGREQGAEHGLLRAADRRVQLRLGPLRGLARALLLDVAQGLLVVLGGHEGQHAEQDQRRANGQGEGEQDPPTLVGRFAQAGSLTAAARGPGE